MSKLSINSLLIIGAIVAFVVVFRLVPHPANFAPVGALALMGGLLLPRKYALWLPITAMAISDLIIGVHPLVLWTWGSFMIIALMSSTFLAKRNIGVGTIFAGALASGLLFFAVTNFGVWLQSGMYSHTFTGLVQCYYNALPFLRNTLLGDIFFSAAFYAVYLLSKDVKLNFHKISRYTSMQ